MVSESDKKRFGLEYSEEHKEWLIRCYQGHSIQGIDSDQALTKIGSLAELNQIVQQSQSADTHYQEITSVVHGTYYKAWEAIKTSGLNKMTRNHVHLSIGVRGDKQVISGMRNSCEVYIHLDLDRSIQGGMAFYVSENQVVLTSGLSGAIPPAYFSKVTDCHGNTLS